MGFLSLMLLGCYDSKPCAFLSPRSPVPSCLLHTSPWSSPAAHSAVSPGTAAAAPSTAPSCWTHSHHGPSLVQHGAWQSEGEPMRERGMLTILAVLKSVCCPDPQSEGKELGLTILAVLKSVCCPDPQSKGKELGLTILAVLKSVQTLSRKGKN